MSTPESRRRARLNREIARRPAHDLDAVDRGERNPIPVDPAAERIVERPAVGDDERPARPNRTPRSVTPCVVGFATRDDERRNRLKPGVLRSASSTAPAADVRSGRRHDRGAGGRIHAGGAARRRDRHRFGQRPGQQDDAQRALASQGERRVAEPIGADAQGAFRASCLIEGEPALGARLDRTRLPALDLERDARAPRAPEVSITMPATGALA